MQIRRQVKIVAAVALITGAGRMRSIGRAIAVALAQGGCDIVITGSGRSPEDYPEEEKAAGWRDIDSVAEEVRALGRRALPLVASAFACLLVHHLGSTLPLIDRLEPARFTIATRSAALMSTNLS